MKKLLSILLMGFIFFAPLMNAYPYRYVELGNRKKRVHLFHDFDSPYQAKNDQDLLEYRSSLSGLAKALKKRINETETGVSFLWELGKSSFDMKPPSENETQQFYKDYLFALGSSVAYESQDNSRVKFIPCDNFGEPVGNLATFLCMINFVDLPLSKCVGEDHPIQGLCNKIRNKVDVKTYTYLVKEWEALKERISQWFKMGEGMEGEALAGLIVEGNRLFLRLGDLEFLFNLFATDDQDSIIYASKIRAARLEAHLKNLGFSQAFSCGPKSDGLSWKEFPPYVRAEMWKRVADHSALQAMNQEKSTLRKWLGRNWLLGAGILGLGVAAWYAYDYWKNNHQ